MAQLQSLPKTPKVVRIGKQVTLDDISLDLSKQDWKEVSQIYEKRSPLRPKKGIQINFRKISHTREEEISSVAEGSMTPSVARLYAKSLNMPSDTLQNCKNKRKMWANVKRSTVNSENISGLSLDSRDRWRSMSSDQRGSWKSRKNTVRRFITAVLTCDCDEPFFPSEEEMDVSTAYTKRLRMMHEKAPFDDIQVRFHI